MSEATDSVNFYRAYKAARIERYREYAANAQRRATTANARADSIASFIPFGQPILVGHHSEKRHRRDLDRIHSNMRKRFDEEKKARYWESRAQAAESNTAISSHDPDALTLLAARIAVLEGRQAHMKAVNAAHKRFLKAPASLDRTDFSEATKEAIRLYKPQYSWEPHPYPPYALSNNNANIRRLKERLADLERRRNTPAAPDVDLPCGVTIREDAERDSINISFPGKPSEEIRAQLKANGFRWSSMSREWYARRSNRARYALAELFPELR